MYLGLASIIPSVAAGGLHIAAKTLGNGLDDAVRYLAKFSTGKLKGMDRSFVYIGGSRYPYNTLAQAGNLAHKTTSVASITAPAGASSSLATASTSAASTSAASTSASAAGTGLRAPNPAQFANQASSLKPVPVSIPKGATIDGALNAQIRLVGKARRGRASIEQAVKFANDAIPANVSIRT
jgi:hypothetical protein